MSYELSDEEIFLSRDEVSVVALTPEEAALARSILERLVGHRSASGEAPPRPLREQSAIELARTVHLARKRRSEHFGPVLFSEPAWDMLLILYIYGDRGGDRLSVTRLAEFGEAPLTTAIRWLDYLESQRLIIRNQCQFDRRKYYVELSKKGHDLMTGYFESLLADR